MKKNTQKNFKNIYLKTFLYGVLFSFLVTPFFTYAATTYSQDLFGLFEYAKAIINDIVLWLIVTGAVCFYIYKLVKMIWDGKFDSDAKQYILYGLIALTLMFTFYAVASLIAVTFGIPIAIPQFFKEQDGLSPGSGNINRSYGVIGA